MFVMKVSLNFHHEHSIVLTAAPGSPRMMFTESWSRDQLMQKAFWNLETLVLDFEESEKRGTMKINGTRRTIQTV